MIKVALIRLGRKDGRWNWTVRNEDGTFYRTNGKYNMLEADALEAAKSAVPSGEEICIKRYWHGHGEI